MSAPTSLDRASVEVPPTRPEHIAPRPQPTPAGDAPPVSEATQITASIGKRQTTVQVSEDAATDTISACIRDAGGELIEGLDPVRLAMLPANESGNAHRFVKRYGRRFRYVPNMGWYAFTGTHWSLTEGERLATLAAAEMAELIHDEASALEQSAGPCAAVKALHRLATRSGNSRTIAGMLSLAEDHLAATIADFDTEPLALNCLNGTIRFFRDEKEGWNTRLDPHSAGDMISRLAAVRYDPLSEAPLWHKHLKRMMPDEAMRDYIQRVFGYVSTGLTLEQAFFVLQGRGGDGKSTTVNTIRRVLGAYASTCDVRTFLASRDASGGGGDRASPALARLAGDVRMVATSEPPRGSFLNEGLVKAATGGAPLAARHLNKDVFEYTPRWKLILECNAMPSVSGEDHGIWRRAKIISWGVQLKRNEMNPNLENELVSEGQGVLNWLAQGAIDYLERGELAEPTQARELVADFRRGSNSFGEWLADKVVFDPKGSETQKAFYASYVRFCEELGDEPLNNRSFGRALSNQLITIIEGPCGRTKDKARDQIRFGARLKTVADEQPEDRERQMPTSTSLDVEIAASCLDEFETV